MRLLRRARCALLAMTPNLSVIARSAQRARRSNLMNVKEAHHSLRYVTILADWYK
jgi:hypothetical protein